MEKQEIIERLKKAHKNANESELEAIQDMYKNNKYMLELMASLTWSNTMSKVRAEACIEALLQEYEVYYTKGEFVTRKPSWMI